MSNSTKLANPMKVITGKDTRWSYANVWEAKSINGGTPKFSVSLIIPKTDTVIVQKIKAAIQAAYEEGQAKLKGNAHPEAVKQKAVYTFTCPECGKEFTAYGNAKRKYCSHDCYIAARFKGGDAR